MNIGDFDSRRPKAFGYFISALSGAIIGGCLLLVFAPAAFFDKPVQSQAKAVKEVNAANATTGAAVSLSSIKSSAGSMDMEGSVNRALPSIVGLYQSKGGKDLRKVFKAGDVFTGTVIDSDGYILCSFEAAEGCKSGCKVCLSDNTVIDGSVVWSDKELGFGIIKAAGKNLHAMDFADERKLKTGDDLITIGAAFTSPFQRTAAAGRAGMLQRCIYNKKGEPVEGLFQMDVELTNNGSPVINSDNQLVGLYSQEYSYGEGTGLVLYTSIIMPVLDSLKGSNGFNAPVTGIKGRDRYVISEDAPIQRGIEVTDIAKGSPAEKAGLKVKDIMLGANGEALDCLYDLKRITYAAGSGKTLSLSVKGTDGNLRRVDLQL